METIDSKEVTRIQVLAHELKVEQAMTRDVVTISSQATMGDLYQLLHGKRISGVPVVERNQMVGIVSTEDLVKALANGELDASIESKMVPNPETLNADEPLLHAVAKFTELGYGRFPVVNRKGDLVGIITQGDISQAMLRQLEVDFHEEELYRYRASHIFQDIVADQIALVFGYQIAARDFDRAGEASGGLRKTLQRLGIHPQVIRRVAVATYEAEMNIVVFTDGGEIVAEVRPERIKIDFLDKGPGIPDIEQAMKPGFSTAPEWVQAMGFGAGMGLPNIQTCADKMTLNSTVGVGTHLELIIFTK